MAATPAVSGPGGGERGKHGEGVGSLILGAADVASRLAAVRQERLELGNQVSGMAVQAGGNLDEDLYRPVRRERVRAADLAGPRAGREAAAAAASKFSGRTSTG